MKKIYFACSIRGGRDDADMYRQIVEFLKTKATVLTEIFADSKLTSAGMNKPNEEIWQTDIAWIKEADAVVAEVSNPSLGVGYEIAKAEEWGKPVLVLFKENNNKLSAMIAGSPNVQVANYQSIEQAEKAVNQFIESLQK